MDMALLEVDLIPPQGDQLGYSQAMTVSNQNHCSVSVSMAANRPCRFDKRFDFVWR